MARLLTALLLVCYAAPAAAGPAEVAVGPLDDPRLTKQVSLELRKAPLSEVVARLGVAAGVTMRAAREVADEPAVVVVRDRPAREVMRQLALLFDYRWRRSGEAGAARFTLYQDPAARRKEEALRDAGLARALADLQAALRARLELAARPPEAVLAEADAFDDGREGKGPAVPPEKQHAIIRREGGTFVFRQMAGSHWRALARIAASLAPEHWESLAAGRTLWLSTREEPRTARLAPSLEQTLREARGVHLPPGLRARFASPDGAELAARTEQLAQEQWGRAEGFRVTVRMEVVEATGDPEARLYLRAFTLMPPDAGGRQETAFTLQVSSAEAAIARAEAVEDDLQADDPLLQRQRPFELEPPPYRPNHPTTGWQSRALFRLARTFEINLVADAYRHASFTLPRLPQPVPLRAALRAAAGPVSRVTRADDFFRIRRRSWYHDRLAEIPERLARQWEERLRKRPSVTTGELAELATALRDAQLENFAAVLRERGIDLGDHFWLDVVANGSLLRAYAALHPQQRGALAAGRAVSTASMPLAARRWFSILLAKRQTNDESPPQPAEVTLESPPLLRRAAAAGELVSAQYYPQDPRLLGPGEALNRPLATRQEPRREGESLPSETVVRNQYFRFRTPDRRIHMIYVFPPSIRFVPPDTDP